MLIFLLLTVCTFVSYNPICKWPCVLLCFVVTPKSLPRPSTRSLPSPRMSSRFQRPPSFASSSRPTFTTTSHVRRADKFSASPFPSLQQQNRAVRTNRRSLFLQSPSSYAATSRRPILTSLWWASLRVFNFCETHAFLKIFLFHAKTYPSRLLLPCGKTELAAPTVDHFSYSPRTVLVMQPPRDDQRWHFRCAYGVYLEFFFFSKLSDRRSVFSVMAEGGPSKR